MHKAWLYRILESIADEAFLPSIKVLSEDLNYLLPATKFQLMRKVLKREVLTLIRDEITRL